MENKRWLYWMDDVGCTIQGLFNEKEEAKFIKSGSWQVIARADTEAELTKAIELMNEQKCE